MADINIGKITKKFTTPIGTAVYPRLSTPDVKFKKEGEYSVKLRLEGDDASSFRATVDAFHEDAYRKALENCGKAKLKKAAHYPIRPVEDEDGNEIPGQCFLIAKMKASGVSREGRPWTQKPIVVDAKKNPVGEMVGGGSRLRVAGMIRAYYNASLGFGLKFDLKAVQVLELHALGDFTDEFEEEEDGFEASAPAANTTEGDSGDGEDGEDF